MNNQDCGSRINSIVLPQFGNSTINNLNNNTLVNIISQVEDEIPYNISEHQMPLSDEDNIIKILKSKDYFQDQSNEVLSLVLGEILYISAFKGMKIYDLNDESNYFFIIYKGSANLIKNYQPNEKQPKNENITKNSDFKKTFGPWDSFGEISFYNEKKRNEIMIAKENIEIYAIDSESCRELLKRNNEIVLKEKYDFLNNISIFESLDKISKYNVAQKLKKKEFPPNTKIIKKGDIYYQGRYSFL